MFYRERMSKFVAASPFGGFNVRDIYEVTTQPLPSIA